MSIFFTNHLNTLKDISDYLSKLNNNPALVGLNQQCQTLEQWLGNLIISNNVSKQDYLRVKNIIKNSFKEIKRMCSTSTKNKEIINNINDCLKVLFADFDKKFMPTKSRGL